MGTRKFGDPFIIIPALCEDAPELDFPDERTFQVAMTEIMISNLDSQEYVKDIAINIFSMQKPEQKYFLHFIKYISQRRKTYKCLANLYLLIAPFIIPMGSEAPKAKDHNFSKFLVKSGLKLRSGERFFEPTSLRDLEIGLPFTSPLPFIKYDLIQCLRSFARNSSNIMDALKERKVQDFCAFYGAVKCFKFLLTNGFNVTPETMLSAVRGGNNEIIQICLNNGQTLEKMLISAVAYHHHDIVEYLIENDIDTDLNIWFCLKGNSTYELLRFISWGADINKKYASNISPLSETLIATPWLTRLLLDRNAIIDPMILFTKSTQFCKESYDILLNRVDPQIFLNEQDRSGLTPIIAALAEKKYELYYILLDYDETDFTKCDNFGHNTIFYAIKTGELEIVKSLFKRHPELLTRRDDKGSTPLIISSKFENTEITKYIYDSLIQNGITNCITDLNKKGNSALMKACKKGHFNTVQFLVENGASINHVNKFTSFTPLALAILKRHQTIIQYLLEHGAIIDDKSAVLSVRRNPYTKSRRALSTPTHI